METAQRGRLYKFVAGGDFAPAKVAKDYAQIILGSLVVAVAYVYFFSPHKIIPGGVYGISIVLHYKSVDWFGLSEGIPMGLTSMCFNIPLIVIATRMFGKGYMMRTIVTFVSTALFTDMLGYLQSRTGVYALVEGGEDLLLSCVFGSGIFAFGVSVILKAKGTSAGTDVLAKVMSRFVHIPVGYSIIIIDSVIVLFGFIAFGELRVPMYSLFTVIVYGKMVDVFMQGLQFNKAVLIITDKPDLIAGQIIHTLHRSGNFIKGTGIYSGVERQIIYTVIGNKQLIVLREFVKEIDPNAFVTVLNANEILGSGFKAIDDKD
ncbi:MAG: YitT family protein [Candidatus Aphodosoma sp.]